MAFAGRAGAAGRRPGGRQRCGSDQGKSTDVEGTIRGRHLQALALSLIGICGWAGMCWPALAQGAATTTSIPAPALTTAPGSPFSTGGESASGISYTPNGTLLRRQPAGERHVWRLADDARCVQHRRALGVGVGGGHEGESRRPGLSPDGHDLAVAGAVNQLPSGTYCGGHSISMYSVGADGSLTLIPGSSVETTAPEPTALAFSPRRERACGGHGQRCRRLLGVGQR